MVGWQLAVLLLLSAAVGIIAGKIFDSIGALVERRERRRRDAADAAKTVFCKSEVGADDEGKLTEKYIRIYRRLREEFRRE